KELQSIVDYTRAPAVTNSPAIDPVFECSVIEDEGGGDDYPFYWTNTTHLDGPADHKYTQAVYVSFGRALGWMQPPPQFEWTLWDVHGAGAQRSDPKVGDPEDYPHGRGPQGDVIRVYNYVRLVRGQSEPYSVKEDHGMLPTGMQLIQNYPNPFNSTATITYQLLRMGQVSLIVYDLNGKLVTTIFNGMQSVGGHQVIWNAGAFPSGVYLCRLQAGAVRDNVKMVLIR
ncbi:MAG: T9SS type A sorting domain-containing protein, partial [Calditrichaeota bacterium]|nr:T9SS type A sorting domain-containing protein [Calditrichota bacterium]